MRYASVLIVFAKLMYIIVVSSNSAVLIYSSTQRFKNLARAVSVGFPAAATCQSSVR